MRGLRNARLRHESVTGTSGEERRTTASEVAVNVMNGMRGDITYPDCKSTAASAVTAIDTVRWMYVLYVHTSDKVGKSLRENIYSDDTPQES